MEHYFKIRAIIWKQQRKLPEDCDKMEHYFKLKWSTISSDRGDYMETAAEVKERT